MCRTGKQDSRERINNETTVHRVYACAYAPMRSNETQGQEGSNKWRGSKQDLGAGARPQGAARVRQPLWPPGCGTLSPGGCWDRRSWWQRSHQRPQGARDLREV